MFEINNNAVCTTFAHTAKDGEAYELFHLLMMETRTENRFLLRCEAAINN